MSKQQILSIVTLLLITAQQILSENNRCLPPNNFLLEEKCVQDCGIDYVVMQGTFKCIPRIECINKGQVSEFGEQYFPYCIQDPPQIRDDFISSDNTCGLEDTKKIFMTGTCMTFYEILKLKLIDIGIFNEGQDILFSKSLIKEILQKSDITLLQVLKNQFNLNCELIYSDGNKCITKSECIKNRFNVSSGDCVETCQNGLISHDYECKRKENFKENELFENLDKTWGLKHTCLNFKQNGKCLEECGGNIQLDFSTGIVYCKYKNGDDLYTSNKVNLLQEIYPKCNNPGRKDCFEFCTKDNYLLSEIRLFTQFNKYLKKCEEKHNIQFGIFHIARDDCPYYISNQQCVKQCEEGFKWIQRKNFKECIPCNRMITGICSDRCLINLMSFYEGFQCLSSIDPYSFHYESLDQQGRCIFPKMLSKDLKSCIDECGKNEIPQKIDGSDEFNCIENNNSEIPKIEQNFYLSSKKTRYVEKCNYINEIECSNACIKRSEEFGSQQPCDWKIKEELEFIETEKERLLSKYWSPEFMEENIQWYFKRINIEVPSIEERIFLLARMTHLAMEFSQKYAEYADYNKGQLIIKNDRKSILVKVAVIPSKGGLFETSINFNNSLNTNTLEIKTVETVLIQTLSLTHYNSEYVICTSEDSCSYTQFIILQKLMQEESSEIEPEFEIEFKIDDVKGEITGNRKKYICFDGQIGDLFSQRTDAQLNRDGENVSSITCKGKGFIGYYYGTKDDVISLKTKDYYEIIIGKKNLHIKQEDLKNEKAEFNMEKEQFQQEKTDQQNQINGKLTSLQNQLNQAKDELAGEQDKLRETQGILAGKQVQLTETEDELAKTKGELSNTKGELSNTKGELAEVKGKLTETQRLLEKNQRELNQLKQKWNQSHPEIVNSETNEKETSNDETITKDTEISDDRKKFNLDQAKLKNDQNDLTNGQAKLAQDQSQLRAEREQFEKEKNLKNVRNQLQVENKSGSNLTQILLIVAVSVLGGIIIIYIIFKLVFK